MINDVMDANNEDVDLGENEDLVEKMI